MAVSLAATVVVPASAGVRLNPKGLAGRAFVPGEVLVRFDPSASATAAEVRAVPGARVLEAFGLVPGLRLVRLPAGLTVAQAVARYRSTRGVRYAEPNMVWPIAAAPNDPKFPLQWNLRNTGQNVGGSVGTPGDDVGAIRAWSITKGSRSVVVATIDTGIDYTHPDLVANVWSNPAECNGTPGVDDDGNGYVDDCHGIDTFNGDSDPMDDNEHGTHVAGIIGAVGNNAIGVTGVNWRVSILACKSHDASGNGTSASVLGCLQYVQVMRGRGVNIVATNNSYGDCPEACGYSQALHDAIVAQMADGILFVAAAGNNGSNDDTQPFYPASYAVPNVVAVAATDNQDRMAGFSSYGRRTVSLGAPGVNVLSTLPGGGYGSLSGTSMSSPHVAGVAALIASADPALDWRAIRNLLLAGGDHDPALKSVTVAGRRLDAYGSLTCSNRVVFGLLQPRASVKGGKRTTVAALNIDCAAPAGPLTATVQPGGQVLTFSDDGTGPDLAADDGIYSVRWTPDACPTGPVNLNFSNGRSIAIAVTPNCASNAAR